MKASLIVLLVGGILLVALLFAQLRWIDAPRHELGLRRAWSAGAIALIFAALASLHALFVEAEQPPEDHNLRLLPVVPDEERPASPTPPPSYPYLPPYRDTRPGTPPPPPPPPPRS